MDQNKIIQIAAIGASGHGMSSILNKIANSYIFETTDTLITKTRTIQTYDIQVNDSNQINQYTIRLIDTPGLDFDQKSYINTSENADYILYIMRTTSGANEVNKFQRFHQYHDKSIPVKVILTFCNEAYDQKQIIQLLRSCSVDFEYEENVNAQTVFKWVTSQMLKS